MSNTDQGPAGPSRRLLQSAFPLLLCAAAAGLLALPAAFSQSADRDAPAGVTPTAGEADDQAPPSDAVPTWSIDRQILVRRQSRLKTTVQQTTEMIARTQEEISKAQQEVEKLHQSAQVAEQGLYDAGVSAETLEPVLQMLTVRNLEVELDLHGAEARAKATELAIAKASEPQQLALRTASLMVEESQLNLEAAMAEMAQVQALYKRNVMTEAQVRQATLAVERGKIQVERSKLAAQQPAELPSSKHLIDALRDLRIDVTELHARHDFIQQRLGEMSPLRNVRRDYQQLTANRIPAAADRLRRLHEELNANQNRLDRAQRDLAQIERMLLPSDKRNP